MSQLPILEFPVRHANSAGGETLNLQAALACAGVSFHTRETMLRSLPFGWGDTTAGSETELQVAVEGARDRVDLPDFMVRSNFFANIARRTATGESPRSQLKALEHWLQDNPGNVWENSWVRLPLARLSPGALQVLQRDLLADKQRPELGQRQDVQQFLTGSLQDPILRLPVSYLIKLALADALGTQPTLPVQLQQMGTGLLDHFLNDNSSPETFSFYVVPLEQQGGRGIAWETSQRFLFTQLLVMYANQAFGLMESGQRALIYFAPHPPIRQQKLNSLIPDSFYRELFMSPCLSGWDRGEEKHRYMQLCHQVLSRSQLNATIKLREAGIISNNLVVLPNVSNVSLANNGVHLSLGSRRLTEAMGDPGSGFSPAHEKGLGDLVIKVTEHFLPLFVGLYSAAPYRLAFTDFHPERALGYLPHELDFTHLRMLWRRWRKKARLSVLGQPITPFGPPWLDHLVSGAFGLRGDYVPDFRLIDYLVCLLSTERSPGLDGRLGNTEALRQDLAAMGVFDSQMSVYLLYKLREFQRMGFSGFEGRHYSLFESLEMDMGRAADLQNLLTALAFKYIAEGTLSHAHIPDDPTVESERRQVFFASAMGIPTFYVDPETPNLFLQRILAHTTHTRRSKRYSGYLRVKLQDYRRALLRMIQLDAMDLVEMLGLRDTLADLSERLEDPKGHSAEGRLTRGILDTLNARDPLKVDAETFNAGAERYYRQGLRHQHLREGMEFLEEGLRRIESRLVGDEQLRQAFHALAPASSIPTYLHNVQKDLLDETLPLQELRRLINLSLLSIHFESQQADRRTTGLHDANHPPVRRAV